MSNNNIKRIIPNFFTSLNIFFGFLSVVKSYENEFILASLLIVIAAVMDALDGVFARLTNSSSKFGIELDSLADVVSFGFAPSFLIYSTYLKEFGLWGVVASSLFLLAAAFRLARFNVELVGYSKKYFYGLPSPTAAITISSFVFMAHRVNSFYFDRNYFSLFLIILVAFLMISRIKFDAIPPISLKSIKEFPIPFLFILLGIITAIFSSGNAVFYIFVLLILFGIFRQIFSFFIAEKSNNIN